MICTCSINNIVELNIFSDLEINDFINKIYSKTINEENLDIHIYLKVANEFEKQLNIGWVDIPASYNKEYDVYFGMLESVYIFSAAKQYQMIREMIEFINLEYSEFIIKSKSIFNKYMIVYLSAEAEMCEIQGNSAKKFISLLEWGNE